MKYKVQNAKILTPDELLSILCKGAKLYSEYMRDRVICDNLWNLRMKRQMRRVFPAF